MLAKIFGRKIRDDDGGEKKNGDKKAIVLEKTPLEKSFESVISSLRMKMKEQPCPPNPLYDGVWYAIPRELLREIFSQLDLKTLLTCRSVCRSWERLCLKSTPVVLLPNNCSDEQLAVILLTVPRARLLQFPQNVKITRAGWLMIRDGMKQPRIDVSRVDNSLMLNNFQVDLYHLHLHELALPIANRCIELRANEPTYLTNRASLYQSLHRLPEALEDFSRALKLSPNSPPLHNSRGLVLYNLGRLSEAIEEHSESIRLHPEDYVFWNNRGLAFYKLGSYQEALDDFSQSLLRHPSNSVGLYNRGRVLCDMDRLTEAEADFKNSLQLCHWRDLAGFFRCGKVLEKQGKADEALTLFKSAMEKQLEPKDAEDWHALGQILQRLQKFEDSIEAFDSALQLQPYNPEYLEARAKSMNAVGRIGEALEDKERSLELRLRPSQQC